MPPTVPLYFTRVVEPVLATKADGSLTTINPVGSSVAVSGLFGHESFVLPDGKVVLIGGASQDQVSRENKTRIPTLFYTKQAQLFNPDGNTYTPLAVTDDSATWVNRIDFTLTPFEAPPALTGSAVNSDRPTDPALIERFLLVGGRKGVVDKTEKDLVNLVTSSDVGEAYGDVYIARYKAGTAIAPATDRRSRAGALRAHHDLPR